MSAFCFYLSIVIRLGDFSLSTIHTNILIKAIVLITITQSITFYLSGLYKGIWRYSSTHDLLRLIKGSFFAVTFSFLILFLTTRLQEIPRSTVFIDWLLLVMSLGGARFTYRIFRDNISLKLQADNCQKIIIIGAGNGGNQILREVKQNPSLNLYVYGFLDDASTKQGKIIHGVPVLGKINDLKEVSLRENIKTVFIAIPSASSKEIRKIIEKGNGLGIEYKILPTMTDFINGKVSISQLKNVEPEDLLGRKPITLNAKSLGELITGNVILVTGAGGSIGAELCKQISRFAPKCIVIIEQNEFAMYQLVHEFKDQFPDTIIIPIIGDVRNEAKINEVFAKFRPKVIFHAAAYKHVPLMEQNPYESIQTNIKGTQIIATMAARYEVEKFVLVSTDKAVNPTNTMGATKRIAELLINKLQKKSPRTKFMIVRFGNVLGSSGSVIPHFQKQIKAGGPVTVTHKEINRYFMSISEACQLVIQASSFGKGDEIFVLDMGEPVKIDNLARQMITLYGLVPDKDIEIQYTGLRPGEKLYEELLSNKEDTLPTVHPLVRIAKTREVSEQFEEKCQKLLEMCSSNTSQAFRDMLKRIIPEYNPQNVGRDNLLAHSIINQDNEHEKELLSVEDEIKETLQ